MATKSKVRKLQNHEHAPHGSEAEGMVTMAAPVEPGAAEDREIIEAGETPLTPAEEVTAGPLADLHERLAKIPPLPPFDLPAESGATSPSAAASSTEDEQIR